MYSSCKRGVKRRRISSVEQWSLCQLQAKRVCDCSSTNELGKIAYFHAQSVELEIFGILLNNKK